MNIMFKFLSPSSLGIVLTLINGNGVRHAIAGAHDNDLNLARSVKREHCLNRNVHCGHVEALKLGRMFVKSPVALTART